MEEKEIISEIKKNLPRGALITDYSFEGANIVLYTKNKKLIGEEGKEIVRKIVDKLKKRVEIRMEPSMLMEKEKARKIIEDLIPKDAGLVDIWFDEKRSIVIIEAAKPGVVIGKEGEIVKQIREKTLWVPRVRRAPAIKSPIVRGIRETLFKASDYRRKFLNNIGKRIYSKWERDSKYWIRISCLGGFREVGRSAILLQTPESNVLLDCGVNVANVEQAYPYFNVPEFSLDELDAVVISHAHLDHCGLIPYLYKCGYRGPVYFTEPTRDIITLLLLDFIEVSQKNLKNAIFNSRDVKEMIKHSVTLSYGEVTDITPDVRLTFFNAGHTLGSSLCHLNVGNGYHNILYTGDFKFARSKLLEASEYRFQRLETLIMESTYGGKGDIQPPRKECEKFLVKIINDTINRGGKAIIPVLGVGRGQDILLVLEEAIRKKKIKEIPVYVDGMVWDITALHTTYPEFMNRSIRKMIFELDINPFLAPFFYRVGSSDERKKVIESREPCVIVATSGMLTGGPIMEYFRELAGFKENSLIFVSYQAEGSLGRRIQSGEREIRMESNGRIENVKVKLEVYTIDGFSGHSDRNQLMNYVQVLNPKPRKVIVCHGESSKCLDLASSIHKTLRVETVCPRNLDAIRIR